MRLTWLEFIIIALAVFRVQRLLREDIITEPLRERTVERLHPSSKIRELFQCAWCLGFWLSLIAAGMTVLWPVVTTWLALPFALSAIVGLIAEHS